MADGCEIDGRSMNDPSPDTPESPAPYPVEVWRRFSAPAFCAEAPYEPDLRVSVSSPAAELEVDLLLQLTGERVSHCRFLAYGCPFTIAIADWLAQWCEGRSVSEIEAFSVEELRRALEIPEERAHCWVMAQDLLNKLLVELT